MILGGCLLCLVILSGQIARLTRLFTPKVIGVILMLIALGLLRPMLRFMTDTGESHPMGDGEAFLISLLLVLLISGLSHWLRDFWKSVSILIGMILGIALVLVLEHLLLRKR